MDFSFITFFSAEPGESQGESFAANFDEVRAAEEMGLDAVWIGGVPLRSMVQQHLMLATAMAARTRRIKIATGVHLPGLKAPGERFVAEVPEGASTIDRRGRVIESFRYGFEHVLPADPIHTAEQVAMVDQVSNGRFIYGVGGGTAGDEGRRSHFFEFLELLKKLWTEEEFSGFQGKYYNYPPFPSGASVLPKTVQMPHPPIVVTVDSQQTFVPLGKMGYPIAIGGGTSHNERGDSVLKEDVKNYRQAWKDAGHPGNPGVTNRLRTYVAATKEEVIRNTEAVERARREAYGAGEIPGRGYTPEGSTDLIGTPQEVVERIHQLREDFGTDEVMCEIHLGNLPRESVLQSMRLLTDKVIPKFK